MLFSGEHFKAFLEQKLQLEGSQVRLAKRLNMTQGAIYKFITLGSPPSLDSLLRVCSVYGVRIEAFIAPEASDSSFKPTDQPYPATGFHGEHIVLSGEYMVSTGVPEEWFRARFDADKNSWERSEDGSEISTPLFCGPA